MELHHSGENVNPLLDESIKSINETEDIANSIINQLHIQREQIQGTMHTLCDTNEVTKESRKYLNNINWKICKEKIILLSIILLLSIIDILIFYRLVSNKGSIF